MGGPLGNVFARYFTQARITCVDPFTGNPDQHPGDAAYLEACAWAERRFDRNVAHLAGHVRKIRERSIPALDRLAIDGHVFDVIYIDGSHKTDDVLMDSLLAWRLLKGGSLLIWDDYEKAGPHPPRRAIDLFLALKSQSLLELHRGYPVTVQRRVIA